MVSPNKVCAICQKGYKKSIKRSHSMKAHNVKLRPNLQWLKLSSGQRIKACVKCIKSINRGKVKMPEKT